MAAAVGGGALRRGLRLACLVLGIFLILQALVMTVAITCTNLQWQWPLALITVSMALAGLALIVATARLVPRTMPIVRVPWPEARQAGDEEPVGDRAPRNPG